MEGAAVRARHRAEAAVVGHAHGELDVGADALGVEPVPLHVVLVPVQLVVDQGRLPQSVCRPEPQPLAEHGVDEIHDPRMVEHLGEDGIVEGRFEDVADPQVSHPRVLAVYRAS